MKKSSILEVRSFILGVLYLIFGVYCLSTIFSSVSLLTKVFYAALFIFVFAVALYTEYLRMLYNKAIKSIANEAKPQKGQEQYEYLLKRDPFDSYKQSKILFDTLYYADMLEPKQLLKSVEDNKKYYKEHEENLIVLYYNQYYAHFLLNDLEAMKKDYTPLVRLEKKERDRQDLSPLYGKKFIDALYLFMTKEYDRSYEFFQAMNPETMNAREKLHYYYHFYRLCMAMHKDEKAENIKKKMLRIKGTSPILDKIQ